MNARTLVRTSKMALLVGLLLVPRFASAAPAAKSVLNRGNQLFAAGNYAGAYEAFKEGHQLSPSPVFLRSMAFSLLKLLRHEEARALLQQYLKKYPTAKDREKLASTVAGLEVVVQTKVQVDSTPPGAELFFDTEAAGRVGTTPYRGTIEPGKHLVILRARGYRTTVRPFSIQPRQAVSLKLGLEVPLAVRSTPSGATVHLGSPDAPPLGKTPLDAGLPLGAHTLHVKHPGYRTLTRSVTASTAGPVRLDAALTLGLRVESLPSGATVELDGRATSQVTPTELDATPGSHRVILRLEGYRDFTAEVQVAPGRDAAVRAQLQGGLLTMRTDREGAEVLVGDRSIGRTPLVQASVPLGRQPVRVRHPDRRAFRTALDFTDADHLSADVRLGRGSWPVWTAAGLAVASLIVGTVTGVVAMNRRNTANESTLYGLDGASAGTGWCNENGTPRTGLKSPGGATVTAGDCGYGIHHLSTATFIGAGVAAAFGLTYYLIFVRPRERVTRLPRGTAAAQAATPSLAR